MNPDSVTHRFGRLAKQLGLRARLHDLRHYAATQLIAGGVDVRTVSGRIGHAGGGATTLRVYTHFQAAADRRAAELLEQTLRRPIDATQGLGKGPLAWEATVVPRCPSQDWCVGPCDHS
jgi:hypothetical protein